MGYIRDIQQLLLEQYTHNEHYEKVVRLTDSLKHYHELEDMEHSHAFGLHGIDKSPLTQVKNNLLDSIAKKHMDLVAYQNEHKDHPEYNGHVLHEPLLDMLKTSKDAHDTASSPYYDKYQEEIGL